MYLHTFNISHSNSIVIDFTSLLLLFGFALCIQKFSRQGRDTGSLTHQGTPVVIILMHILIGTLTQSLCPSTIWKQPCLSLSNARESWAPLQEMPGYCAEPRRGGSPEQQFENVSNWVCSSFPHSAWGCDATVVVVFAFQGHTRGIWRFPS